jgi:nitrogen regulatory protein PII
MKTKKKIIDTIQKTASTGEKGDGVVVTYNIDKLAKIRNGETGIAAL